MVHRHHQRATRVLLVVVAAWALTACGPQPLGSVGEASGEWIGPLADGVHLLPSERIPEAVMAAP